MTTRNPDWQGPRNLTGGDGYLVDLGLVSVRDAVINGRNNILIPYASGRLIKAISFAITSASITPDTNSVPFCYFTTPNNGMIEGGKGIGYFAQGESFDTIGMIFNEKGVDIYGSSNVAMMPLDVAPLYFIIDVTDGSGFTIVSQLGTWQPDTPYCKDARILDANDHIQYLNDPGVSGSELPEFDDEGGTTSDGSLTWNDGDLVPGGFVHVIAQVIEGVSPMPPYPATIEWIEQPVNVVAGATMADIVIAVKDQYGNPYGFQNFNVRLNCLGDANGNSDLIEWNGDFDKATGITTLAGLTPSTPGTFVLRASTVPILSVDPIFSDPFDVTSP